MKNTISSENKPLIRWIRNHAHELTTIDPLAPLTDLSKFASMLQDKKVVSFGESTRGARSSHQMHLIKHRFLRFLVEFLGFRSLALEVDWTIGIQVDEYLRTGRGNLRALLSNIWEPLQTEEFFDAIQWMRSYNQQHPNDTIRVFGGYSQGVPANAYDIVLDYVRSISFEHLDELEAHYAVLRSSHQEKQVLINHAKLAYEFVADLPGGENHSIALQYARFIWGFYEQIDLDKLDLDQRFARNMILWHKHTGHKMVYWGGIAHVANNHIIPNRGYSVGSHLRKFFGSDYSSICLTFHHGSGSDTISPPSSEFAEAVLSKAAMDIFLLDLQMEKPESVQLWFKTPTKVRAIGPYYDPKKDPTHLNGFLSDWFDIIIHIQEITPAVRLVSG
ncbi:erythromycin esterase family protein [Shimazuella sp. AN120528]|uniref:erythromycin esterase family protein n=1 Tax=Shimazuella soli TaxID=1892854 RepID=UPI001F10A149|nr:erythromycin esterase family protein [Shimazuella soli]MCH5583522.1 erythromycin esterase family protein [Shimazuella soli]